MTTNFLPPYRFSSDEPAASPPPPPNSYAGPAWERRGGRLVARWVVTVATVLFRPARTLAAMDPRGSILPSALFAAICYTISMIIAEIYLVVFGIEEVNSMFPAEPADQLVGTPFELAVALGILLVLAPIIGLLATTIMSAICHVVLFLLGGTRLGPRATFRATAYVLGATTLFAIIPVCGIVIGGLWGLVILVSAIARLHRTSIPRAAAAVVAAQMFCFLGFVAVMAAAQAL